MRNVYKKAAVVLAGGIALAVGPMAASAGAVTLESTLLPGAEVTPSGVVVPDDVSLPFLNVNGVTKAAQQVA